MPRVSVPPYAEMTARQKQVHDEIAAGKRGRVAGPLLTWLKSPELADRSQRLGEFVRYDTSLSPRLSELSMLVTARFWNAHYEWYAHKKEALKAGVDPAIIEDIKNRKPPKFAKADERAVFEFSDTLHKTHQVPDDKYKAVVDLVGEEGAVELVGLLGYYTLISMTLNAFQVPLPDGVPVELD